MNNEPDKKTASKAGPAPVTPQPDNPPAAPQITASPQTPPTPENGIYPQAQTSPGNGIYPQAQTAPESGSAPGADPRPARRRQHYFTNLPNIGLEAQPLTAPWEADVPDEQSPSEDDYDYPDGYKPNTSNKAAMAVAISGATIVAVAVLVFLTYIFFFNKDNNPPAVPTVPPTTAAAETQPSTQIPADTGLDRTVVMPELVGVKEADAYKKLNAANVRYKVVRSYSEDVPLNYVISQNPEAGEEFLRSSKEAVIYISKGRENEIITSATRPATTAATQPASTSATAASSAAAAVSPDDYILPNSASERLIKSDLAKLDRESLNLALNEILARHGRKFTDPDISAYFLSKSWYQPTIDAKDFQISVLNQYESYNYNLIASYQSELGYR